MARLAIAPYRGGVKTTTISPSAPPVTRLPDFSGHPKRITPDQIVAVKGHAKLCIRPIRLDDEPEMISFHERISEESIYMRYFEYLGLDRRTSHERLVRICTNAPDSYALVVEQPATPHHAAAILAVGRLTKTPEPYVATFDTLMTDEENTRQLAKLLLNRLVKLAHAFGFQFLTGELLVADHDTINLCRSLGFSLQTLPQDGLVRVTLDL
jgi:acetyltransferase